MARSPIKAEEESDLTPPSAETLEFDDATLRAEVNKKEGNDEYKKRDFRSAIDFYTKGIQVNCKDEQLNAILYANRAIAHFCLGNYQDTLSDAQSSRKLRPAYMKAIERGASACEQLHLYEEAITWCNDGLAIDENNKKLLELRTRCVSENKILQSPAEAVTESDLLPPAAQTLDFDDATLRAIAEVYKIDGNEEFGKREFSSAIEFYTKGIEVKCKDEKMNAVLYTNRATAYFYLGEYHDALSDSKAATSRQPSYMKAIVRGASACEKLHLYEEAIRWCNVGLAIDRTNNSLLHMRMVIAKEKGDRAGEGRACNNFGIAYQHLGNFKQAKEYHELDLAIAKQVGDKAREGRACGNLGKAYDGLGDFKQAKEYHKLHLAIAKEVGDRAGEGSAYGNLGNAYFGLGDFKQAIEYHKLHLNIAKEVGDKVREGRACGNLGNAYFELGEFKQAKKYHTLRLNITKEVGDKVGEGRACGSLGNAYFKLGDFKQAIEYHNLHLNIAKEVGDKAGEGSASGNLGIAYQGLGDFEQAKEYHNLHLTLAKEVGDKDEEGLAYCNLGNAYENLGDFKQAIEYKKRHLDITKEVGNRVREGRACGNLGNAYFNLGYLKQAIEYHTLDLNIAKEVGDRAGEGRAYGNLGNAYFHLGYLKQAIEYHTLHLNIAKEVGDRAEEGVAFCNLGNVYQSLGCLSDSSASYQACVECFNGIRSLLQSRDQWKIGLRNKYQAGYTSLWRVLLKRNKILDALCAAENGRAQALVDLMESQYNFGSRHSGGQEEFVFRSLRCTSSNTVFLALGQSKLCTWLLFEGNVVCFTDTEVEAIGFEGEAAKRLESLMEVVHNAIVCGDVKCENRSLDALRDSSTVKEKFEEIKSPEPDYLDRHLRTLYDLIIAPVKHLLNGDELIIVPDGPLFLAPFSALLDSDSHYLCDSLRVRVIPSLTTLKQIIDSPADYHCSSGALLVGEPYIEEILHDKGKIDLWALPSAKLEVEMIGKILKTLPLTGREATKAEVLRRLNSVALIHIAAHGDMKTGEIALAPNPGRPTSTPSLEDYLLTMTDVLSVQLRARLVVLSCCHSGRGEIKAEGVVGIARAFLGAGARSVLVSLWAIDDEATLEFMRRFYKHLADGRRASEALNKAMKCFRESDQFSDVKYWAPFVLIGDDVTIKCFKQEK